MRDTIMIWNIVVSFNFHPRATEPSTYLLLYVLLGILEKNGVFLAVTYASQADLVESLNARSTETSRPRANLLNFKFEYTMK